MERNQFEIKRRAEDSAYLAERLNQNQKYQARDFSKWLLNLLDVKPGEHILDVGCGTGAQTLSFLDTVGKDGLVTALDISRPSIEQLSTVAASDARLTALVADMSELRSVVDSQCQTPRYSFVNSTYSLYYAPDPQDVLQQMVSLLTPAGRVAVAVPVEPHGMVEIASKFSEIPNSVLESLEFGPNVLEPAFREFFDNVSVHFFRADMVIPSIEEFLKFYQSTTYFSADAVDDIRNYLDRELKREGSIRYEKNSYLIIGRDQRQHSRLLTSEAAPSVVNASSPKKENQEEIQFVFASCRPWDREFFYREVGSKTSGWMFVADDHELESFLDQATPTAIVFFNWPWIVEKRIWSNIRCIVVHMTDLPFGRGGSPLQNLILAGYRETMVTVFQMDQGVDTGPIYAKKKVLLDGSAEEIYKRVTTIGWELVASIIEKNSEPEPQKGEVVRFSRRSEAESEIRAFRSLSDLYDHIRMLDARSYPRAFLDAATFRLEFHDAALFEEKLTARITIVYKESSEEQSEDDRQKNDPSRRRSS